MPPERKPILLVEDDPEVCDLLSFLLRDAGYEVVAAGTFAEGRAALDESDARFSLLVTDGVLPDGCGRDLVKLAQERGVRALLMTGNPDRMTLLEGKGIDYLRKPFRPADFLRAVETRLGPERE